MTEQIKIEHLRTVLDYVHQQRTITNRECRIATGVGYDSAIKIFGAMCAVSILRRIGGTSGSKYVPQSDNPGASKITIEHLTVVMNYAAKNGSVTNRQCRQATGVTYNQSIRIFGALCSLGMLRKKGKASATQYIVAEVQTIRPPQPGYHRKKWL